MRTLALSLITSLLLICTESVIARDYPALVTKCHDADTCDMTIDLGFGLTLDEKVRFYRINAWEVTGWEKYKGIPARDAVREKLVGETVTISVPKKVRGKYGRILVDITLSDGTNLNNWIVANNHGKFQDY